jgi:hypothetical protein
MKLVRDMHKCLGPKHTELCYVWFVPTPCFVRSGIVKSVSRGDVLEIHYIGQGIIPVGFW